MGDGGFIQKIHMAPSNYPIPEAHPLVPEQLPDQAV